MADLTHYERGVNAREANRNFSRENQARQKATSIIQRVLKATAGLPEIEILLALGAACPFGLQADRTVWVSEIERLRAEGSGAARPSRPRVDAGNMTNGTSVLSSDALPTCDPAFAFLTSKRDL